MFCVCIFKREHMRSGCPEDGRVVTDLKELTDVAVMYQANVSRLKSYSSDTGYKYK